MSIRTFDDFCKLESKMDGGSKLLGEKEFFDEVEVNFGNELALLLKEKPDIEDFATE